MTLLQGSPAAEPVEDRPHRRLRHPPQQPPQVVVGTLICRYLRFNHGEPVSLSLHLCNPATQVLVLERQKIVLAAQGVNVVTGDHIVLVRLQDKAPTTSGDKAVPS